MSEEKRIKVKFADGTEYEGTIEGLKELKEAGLIAAAPVVAPQKSTQLPEAPSQAPPKLFKRHSSGSVIKVSDLNRYDKAWLPHEISILQHIYKTRKNESRLTSEEVSAATAALPGRTRVGVVAELVKLRKAGLLSNDRDVPPQAPVRAPPVPVPPKPFLTEQEQKDLLVNLHLPIEEIAPKINKTATELENYLHKTYGGIRELRKQHHVTAESRQAEEHKIKMAERMKFMSKRAAVYMTQYNWSREKAYQQASDDWLNNGRGILPDLKPLPAKPKPVAKLEEIQFPKFMYLSTEGNDMLYHVVKSAIANKTPIGYRSVQHLTRQDGSEWRRQDWLDFLEEFMNRSVRICGHFNVPNRFKILQSGNGYEVIKYE